VHRVCRPGSVEKAIKRLPGIHDAAIDVLNNPAQVIFYPAFVSVGLLFSFVLPAKLLLCAKVKEDLAYLAPRTQTSNYDKKTYFSC
jgi:hypothetical protein